MTINKSQDQLLKTVGVNLQTFAFTYSQLYIALLHITILQKITIFIVKNSNNKTKNVIYLEVFIRLFSWYLFMKN